MYAALDEEEYKVYILKYPERGNKSQAARLLGISREGLRKKLKRLAETG